MKPWRLLAVLAIGAAAYGQTRPVEGTVLSNDAWPRATRLSEWTSDVMRISGVEKANETAQGKAFFEWLRLFSRMAVGGMIQSFEGDFGKENSVMDAHKQLFVYGWGFCDTSSRIAEAAWQEYKRDPKAAERVITQHADLGYHTMYRLRMDGKHGAFDPRYGYYLVERDAPDARVLDWSELNGKFIINRGYKHRSRPFFEIHGIEWERALLIQPGYFESEKAYRDAGGPIETVFGDGAYTMGTVHHDMSFTLKRGMTITRYWDNSARKFYVPAGANTKREWPFLASGRFYRVADTSHEGNWPKYDPNYQRMKPYLATIPATEGYPKDLAGGRSIGQAYGVIEYKPKLEDAAYLDAVAPGSTLVQAKSAPYLRPKLAVDGGEAVFDIRSPYVLVDGTLSTTVAGGAEVSIRTLAPKRLNASEPDQWSAWQPLFAGEGSRTAELGRPRFNGRDVSIHGAYRFQVRVKVEQDAVRKTAAGLSALSLKLYFENSITSIPPLFEGKNTLRLRVADAAALSGPVTVTYRYATAGGERTSQRALGRAEFNNGEASYVMEAAGLTRCNSVSISY